MLPRVAVASSCKSRVMLEGGIGKIEDELLNRLFWGGIEEEEEDGRMAPDELVGMYSESLLDKECE